MRKSWAFYLLLFLYSLCIVSARTETVTDDNSAFFQGAKRNYIFSPPPGWQLLIEEPGQDGYSFAFIPKEKSYDSSDVLITITIYTLNNHTYQQLIESDTASLREHYGKAMTIVQHTTLAGKKLENMSAFSLTDKEQFVPTAMLSYYNGEQEIVIFELTLLPQSNRKKAETAFASCVTQFRTLVRKELGVTTKK